MSARHSIGLRLIRWGECLLDHVPQQTVNGLRRSEVHADTGANDSLGRGVSIDDGLGERQVDSTVVLSSLAYEIDMGNRGVIAGNHPGLISYLEGLRFEPNHVFLTHIPSPISNVINDVASLNSKAAGVES